MYPSPFLSVSALLRLSSLTTMCICVHIQTLLHTHTWELGRDGRQPFNGSQLSEVTVLGLLA